MLPDQITLAVDVLNNNTLVNKVFDRIEDPVGRSIYYGVTDQHTQVSRNILGFYRTLPKRSGTSLGTMKSSFKFTRDMAVPNALGATVTMPHIIEVNHSVPVGASVASVLAQREHAAALIISALLMDKLNFNLEV